jgi:phage terminase large subunit
MYKINPNGTIQLESKEDMKERGMHSPDVADALALTLKGDGGE